MNELVSFPAVVELINDGRDGGEAAVYLFNLVFLLLQSLLHDVHGAEQFAQIVLADFIDKYRLLILQSLDLFILFKDAVVQFLDDGQIVSVATLARRMLHNALKWQPLRRCILDIDTHAPGGEAHIHHRCLNLCVGGHEVKPTPHLTVKFLFCHSYFLV